MLKTIKYIIIIFILLTTSRAFSQEMDSIILLDESSYELIKAIKNNPTTKKKVYSQLCKYLFDTTKQKSILYVRSGSTKEPDTYKNHYIVTKQIASMYIICALYYKDIYLGDKLSLYNFASNERIEKGDSNILNSISKKLKKWIRNNKKTFPLSKEGIFWEQIGKPNVSKTFKDRK